MSFLIQGTYPLTIAGNLVNTSAAAPPPVDPPVEPPVTPGADIPSASLAGLWDASILPTGPRYSVPDTSTANKPATVSATNSPKVIPRTFGMVPGLYDEANAGNFTVRQPVISDYAVNAAALPVGANQAFTVALAWTRPNQKQPGGGAFSSVAVDLLKIDGATVVRLGGAGAGADALTLFPDSTSPVSAGTLSIRHTQWLKVVFRGALVDLHLGANKIVTGAANQITLGATANLSFLPNTQCIFHKAAAWSKSHDSTEDGTLASHMAPWAYGERPASYAVLIGQSNAGLLSGTYSLLPLLSKTLTYLTGNPASNILCGGYNISGATLFSGQGLYDTGAGLILNGTGGGDPSTWPLGTNGNTLMAALTGMTAEERANTYGILWYWSESDSAMLTYAKKAEYTAALKRAFSLIRSNLGRTAASLPIMVINPLPFTTAVGCQTHREAMQDVVNDATQNVRYVLANALDAIGQGDSYDAATGIESGAGNSAHRDDVGMLGYVRRMVYPMARAFLAAQVANFKGDALSTLDASLPVTAGPKITAAHWEGGTSVLVTLAHDGGSDLLIPLRAANGVGWSLMDGVSDTVAGTPGAPGALIKATACAKVSATQVRLTLASAPVHAAKGLLYYGYGTGLDANNAFAEIGRGNAVTDNFSQVTLAAGSQIGAYFGAAAQTNNPVQATTYGVALT